MRGFTRVSNLMTSASPLDELHPGLAVILEKFEIGDFFGVKNFCGRRPLLLKEIAGAPSGEVDNGGNRDDDGILK